MEIDKVCRTCLSINGPLLSMYDDGSAGSSGNAGSVAEMLAGFIKYKPKRSDNLPDKICMACISEIIRCHSFKTKCENSIRTLAQLLPKAEIVDSEQEAKAASVVAEKNDQYVQTEPQKKKPPVTILRTKTINRQIQTELEHKEERATSPIVFAEKSPSQGDTLPSKRRRIELRPAQVTKTAYSTRLRTRGSNISLVEATPPEEETEVVLEMIHDSANPDLSSEDHDRSVEYEAEHLGNRKEEATEAGREQEGDDFVENDTDIYYELTTEQYELVQEEIEVEEKQTPKQDQDEEGEEFYVYGDDEESAEGMNFTICSNERGEEEVVPKHRNKISNKRRVQVQAKDKKPKVQETPSASLPTSYAYTCSHCKAGFATVKGLKVHNKMNVCRSVTFKCEQCAKVFMNEKGLEEHKLSHVLSNACYECDVVFKSTEELSNHLVKMHQRNPRYKCDVCKRVFSMLSSLKDHQRIHSGEKPFLCTICGRAFSQNANLRQHILRHSQTKKFPCTECDKGFVTRAELASHMRIHTGAQPFKCEVCSSAFSSSSSLLKHKRRHTGERPYACELCPMRFMSLNVLKNHRRTHTGEKPYKCKYCDKRFTQQGDCVIHQRMHTGQKKYACDMCDSAFFHATSLQAHKKSHRRAMATQEQQTEAEESQGPAKNEEQAEDNYIEIQEVFEVEDAQESYLIETG